MSSQIQQRQQTGPAISSMSLGRAWVHKLSHKLDMAQKHGFKGLELFYEDLEYFSQELQQERERSSFESTLSAAVTTAESHVDDDRNVSADDMTPNSSEPSSPSSKDSEDPRSHIFYAAQILRSMCDARAISILSIQPFYHYEGLLDRDLHATKIARLKTEWLPIAAILGTQLILIPSNFLPKDQLVDDGSSEIIIDDLREAAELGLQCSPVVRFCYENLAWGTHAPRWQDAWSVVQRVNMPNFGICLDAFNISGLVFADPATESGCTPDSHNALAKTVEEMVATLRDHVHKIFIVQIADGEKLARPLIEGHAFFDPAQPARMSWSRNCRLFYGEEGGYLPVASIMRAIVHDLGYKGWISAELFNRRMSDSDSAVPEEMARRGRESWSLFEQDILFADVDDNASTTSTATLMATDNDDIESTIKTATVTVTKPLPDCSEQTKKKLWRTLRHHVMPRHWIPRVMPVTEVEPASGPFHWKK